MLEELSNELKDVNSLDLLAEIESRYVGKKGFITLEFSKLKNIFDPVEKKRLGQLLNSKLKEARQIIKSTKDLITKQNLARKLESEHQDLSLPHRNQTLSAGPHLISRVIKECSTILSSMGFHEAIGPEIENEFYVFDALNSPPHHPAREMQDTFYLKSGGLLRTHTSSVQIREMEKTKGSMKIFSTGKVYRKDWDATHVPMFHQIEGLCVGDEIKFSHLKYCINNFLDKFFGKVETRFRPSFFPFTEPSAEVDIKGTTGWIEILGCGLVHSRVFQNVNIKNKSGFAFGIGVERLIMIKYGLTDIRKLFSNDIRWIKKHNRPFI